MENQPVVIPDYYVPLLDRIKGSFVQSVPEEVAICEFNCAATECSHGAWQTCLRRLASRAKADGPPPN
jgi:hypothetical protein